ncbi:hypothetical protein EDF57_104429 [Novosphingobium sp. PhB55]|uniref:hypothetical protein n=1 Tax=Novosphingobium sp. PhB55 TaxID=2485106 RepID=UPI0010668B6C|nr:hypothetical protein [Novosphingobium sp. PhB55]TDW64630.1 hypothetical protein EDF57_104429 [Novosphingobium sp. PhB55]
MAVVAGGLIVLSAVALYLAAPHQAWGALPLSPRAMGWSGTAMLALGLALLLSWAGIATAFFIAFTLLMTTWSIVPIAVAWWRRSGEDRA